MKKPGLFVLVSLSCIFAFGDVGEERDRKVIQDRDSLERSSTWIYNDLDRAKEIAADAGKPMMIVFRCIP